MKITVTQPALHDDGTIAAVGYISVKLDKEPTGEEQEILFSLGADVLEF